jgi:hypothetical protein
MGQPAGLVRVPDVGDRLGLDHVVLMGQVGHPDTQVEQDVLVLPAGVATDAAGAVHAVVEHRGHSGPGQPGVAGELTAGPDVVVQLPHVGREDLGMVVQAR